MKQALRLLTCAALLLVAGWLAGCSDEKTVATPDGKATVKKTARGVQVKTKDGTVRVEENKKTGTVKVTTDKGDQAVVNTSGGKLVEDFPKDVPVYADAKIVMSQLVEGKHAVATLTTGDQPEQVLHYYKTVLAQNGWEVNDPMTMGGMIMLRGSKDGRVLSVQIARERGDTTITLGMAAE
jgi:hypothetical protein